MTSSPDEEEKAAAQAEPHWSAIGEKTSTAGIRILLFIAANLGAAPFRLALAPVLLFYWLTNARLRRDLLDYQRRIARRLAESSFPIRDARAEALLLKPGLRSALAHLGRFAETILDKIIAASGSDLPKRRLFLDVEGNDLFKADSPSQGAVILTSHAGCQELLSREAGLYTGHPLVILEHTGHARRFNRILERAGRRSDAEAVTADSAREHAAHAQCEFFEVASLSPALAVALAERVERGAYLILAGDRTPLGSEKAVAEAPFLGAPAFFPTGGALLALLLKCPLRMMSCTREASKPSDPPGSARYRVRFASLDEAPKAARSARDAYLARMAQKYAAELEKEILASPFDWFNFYDFWGRAKPEAMSRHTHRAHAGGSAAAPSKGEKAH